MNSPLTLSSHGVSLLIPAKNAEHSLVHTVEAATTFFSSHLSIPYEIILVPNYSTDQTEFIASQLAQRFSEVMTVVHSGTPGKGAALKTGFEASRGKYIFFTDADLPYDLEFYLQALEQLKAGYSLVTGNRRLPESHFVLPVELLKIAHGRHRLGLLFNRVVQVLFGLRTTDTQSGLKAMDRDLATKAFANQTCPGFFFDIEIFLTLRAHRLKHAELPVTLNLRSEKSTVRLVRELFGALNWLSRLAIRNITGAYGAS